MSIKETRHLSVDMVLTEIRQQLIELGTEVEPNSDWRLEEAGLDSFGLLSFVVSLEQRYDIQFSSDELQQLALRTPRDIAITVTAKTEYKRYSKEGQDGQTSSFDE